MAILFFLIPRWFIFASLSIDDSGEGKEKWTVNPFFSLQQQKNFGAISALHFILFPLLFICIGIVLVTNDSSQPTWAIRVLKILSSIHLTSQIIIDKMRMEQQYRDEKNERPRRWWCAPPCQKWKSRECTSAGWSTRRGRRAPFYMRIAKMSPPQRGWTL